MLINAGLTPLNTAFQVNLISAVILSLWLFAAQRDTIKGISTKAKQLLLLMGIIVSIASALAYIGLSMSTAINYGFLIKAGAVIFTTSLAYFFLSEKMGKEKILLLLSLIVGIYLLSTGGQVILPHLGDLIILLSALLLAGGAILTKKIVSEVHPHVIAVVRRMLIALFIGAFLLVTGNIVFNLDLIVLLLISGLAASFGTLYFNKTLSVASASYMTMMSASVPLISLVLAVILLGETMTMISAVGGAIIVGSIIFVHRKNI